MNYYIVLSNPGYDISTIGCLFEKAFEGNYNYDLLFKFLNKSLRP